MRKGEDLHPAVMGGILARRGMAQDDEDRKKFSILLIDVVVCTLYPFEETAEKGADSTILSKRST